MSTQSFGPINLEAAWGKGWRGGDRKALFAWVDELESAPRAPGVARWETAGGDGVEHSFRWLNGAPRGMFRYALAMAGLIPQSFINSLIERADIVEIVGSRLQLRRAGGNHVAPCPFHEEKTPSFHVYPDGHYHCFGCGAHGTTLSFLMEMDGLTFPEAVESLASLMGLEVPREHDAERRPRADSGLQEAVAAASRQFQRWLGDHAEGRAASAYLERRGISGALARDFGIGLAPSGWESLKTALARFGEGKLLDAGLLAKNDRGRVYDRFRGRVVFPIRNKLGKEIGFGGRVYEGSGPDGAGPREGEPKYINSPETDLFRKGQELYGLYEARRANRQPECLVVVEGYMDVIGLAAQGFHQAVATLGTAIGEAHFNRLFRTVDRVICCFDGDAAGRAAAWKAVEAAFPALSERRELRFVFLPEGEDPDTIARKRGAAHFRNLLDAAMSVGEYFLESVSRGLDLDRVDHRATLCDIALPLVARLPDGALRALLLRELATRAHVDAAALERRQRELVAGAGKRRLEPPRQAPPRQAPSPGASSRSEAPAPASKFDEFLLHRFLKDPALFAALPEEQRQPLLAAEGLLGEVARYLGEEPRADTAALLGRFVGEPAHAFLIELAARPLPVTENLAGEVLECVNRLRARERRGQRRQLANRARQTGSLEDLRRLRDARGAGA